jgi:hypothetical protein
VMTLMAVMWSPSKPNPRQELPYPPEGSAYVWWWRMGEGVAGQGVVCYGVRLLQSLMCQMLRCLALEDGGGGGGAGV